MMPDREKVISNLTDLENIMIARQEICPKEELQYWIELQESLSDALALLKEQPQIVHCRDCTHQYFTTKSGSVICGHLEHESEKHNADWFCADGERRTE